MEPHSSTSPHPFQDFDHDRPHTPGTTHPSHGPIPAPLAIPQVTSPIAISLESSSSSSSSSYINLPNATTTSTTSTTMPTHNATGSSSSSNSSLSLRHHHHSHHTPPIGPPLPPPPPSTTPTSITTSAVARFSQAFSPLLSSRRKSTVIDIPSTPDGHKSFSFPVYNYPDSVQYSSSQEHLSGAGHANAGTGSQHPAQPSGSSYQSHVESNFSKISSFSTPRSTNRSRKAHPGGIANTPDETGYGSFATPPLTATAFHTGLASHFGAGPVSGQNREHHDIITHKESKGSIVSGSSSIEKALKKARVFLDEKAKPKARAVSLWSFLDVTFELDQAKFFQEHGDQVFTVTHDSFWHQVDKFKQKPDRNNALQSKEVTSVQKTLLLLRLIFLYLPDRIKNGWNRQRIAKILNQILCHKNHPRIRIFGFRLLLLWLNDQTVEYHEAMYLFQNAISLDLFMYDGDDLSTEYANLSQTRLPLSSTSSIGRKTGKQVSQYFETAYVNLNQELLLSDGPPICPNPSPPTFQDSIQLLQIFLGNIVRMAYVAAGSTPPPGELESINSHFPLEADGRKSDGIAVGFGIDAGLAAARFMFDIIKKYYLVKVFPECARKLQLIGNEVKEFGYKICPPTILRTIISFIIQYCLDSNEFNSPQTHTSPATPILKSIVFSSEVNREMMHEIVRQGLSLPPGHPQYKDIIRGAVHIVGVWCLSGDEERPAFLRSSINRSQVPSSASSVSLGNQESGSLLQSPPGEASPANSFLQRYFQLLTNVFAESRVSLHDLGSNSSSEALGSTGNHVKLDGDALFHLYKDILGLFRAFIVRGHIEMDAKSWEILLGSLLEIQRRILSLQERLSSTMSGNSIDELVCTIIETVLCAHSRCPNVTEAQWIALRKSITEALRYPQTITQWAKQSVRMTHVLAHEVFQVDLEVQTTRPAQTSTARHNRKMSDKYRRSGIHTSKAENSMRHSIGGELLSSQTINYSHQTYPLSNLTGERPSRRTNSVHYDPSKQPGTAINGPPVYTPSLLGHMVFTPNRDSARADHHSNLKTEIGETEDEDWNDHVGSHFSALTEGLDTNDDRLSRASSLSFHGPDSLHLDPIVERLSPMYGKFSSNEFVNISMRSRSPEYILSVWKNIICSIGNPNDIQIPLVKTEAMLCLLDIWDLLHQIRTSQSINAAFIPPLYDFAPWFFEAAKSNSDGGVGLPTIYGGLCRMMSRRYDQDFDPEFYKMFYASVAQGLTIDDSMIGHSIISNSSRLFTLSLPGSHVLVLPFLSAIRHMLLKDGNLRDGVNHHIRKQAIAILCSVSMLFYDFGSQQPRRIGTSEGSSPADIAQDQDDEIDLLSHKQTFARLVLDLTTAEANVKPLGKFWDTHSMLIQLCGMLVVNEWSSSLITCDKEAENELLLKVLDHLYWTEISIVQSAVEVITTLASMYRDHEDNDWTVLEKVLSHLLSAMQEHLKLFQSDGRRGCMIASFYRCLTEWLMVIPAKIFSETDLSKRVFDLIEVGLLCGPDSTGENERRRALQAARQQQQQQYQQQQQFRTNKERGPSFQHTGKLIHQHHRVMISTGPMVDIETEQQAVKEAAEATLIHLVHFMNDMPFLYGSDKALMTLGMDNGSGSMTETGGASASKDSGLGSQRVFALNNSILVTLEETPANGPMGPYHRVRVIIRDETGRYAWDSEIFYSEMLQLEEGGRPRSMQRAGSRLSERLGSTSRRRKKEMASQLIWREGVKIRDDEDIVAPKVSSAYSNTALASNAQSNGPQSIDSLLWDGNGLRPEGDMLDQLLHYIGDQHPDCLFDGKTPLNQLNNGLTLSTDSRDSTGSFGNGYGNIDNGSGSNGSNDLSNDNNGHKKRSTIDVELDRHVQEENYYSRISDPQARAWYDKLVELRSSLIQSDEDDEDYQGSNTLMSLVVNSNWEEDPLKALGDQNANGKDADPHTEAYNHAKKYSGRRIRHENLQEIHAEAMRNANSSGVSPEMIPQRTSSLMERSADGNDGNVLGSGLLKEDATNMAKAFQLVLPPEPERPLDSYQHSRLLLSHLGLLCFDRFQEHNFVLLNHSQLLDRDLKNLDKKSGREIFKIAVLYVAEGQEGEQAILHNSKGSAAYNRFVHDLGWEVELADHAGYMGGLERNGSNGRSAIYYCSSTLEIIFHEVVRMPTDPDDPRQVKKKRHVGNDHVHIVWSEHSRAYDRNTIGGDFGNVIIVLTPVPDLQIEQDGQMTIRHHHHLKQQQPYSQSAGAKGPSLVSVEVIRDIKLPVFGPLVDGMVVPMSQLGRLVRQTAIHANRLATAPPPLPPTPPSVSFTSTASGAPMVSSAGPGANTGSGGITSMASGAIASAGTGGVSGGGNRSSIYYAQGLPNLQFTSGAQGFQHLLSTSQAVIPGSTSSFASVGNGSGAGQGGIGANSSTTTLPTTVAGAGGPFSTSGPTNTTAAALATSAGTGAVVAGGPTASAHLTASVSSLVNVGSGPNASSASSLVSNSGSVNGGGSASSNTSGSGTVIGMTGPSSIGNFSNASGSSPGMSAVSTNGMASVIGISTSTLSNMTGGPPTFSSQYQQQQQQPLQQQQQQQPQAQHVPNQSSATVTTTATAPAAFSSSMVSMTHNAHPFKQRALAIEQITRRHKIEKWTFQQFMEQVFGYSTLPNQPQHHNHHYNTNYNAKNHGRD